LKLRHERHGHVYALTIEERARSPALTALTSSCGRFRIGGSRFHPLDDTGAFNFLKVHHRPSRALFSAALIAQYVAGELVGAHVRGRRGAHERPQPFPSARDA